MIAAGELAGRLNRNIGPEPALNLGIAYMLRPLCRCGEAAGGGAHRYPAYSLLDFPLAGAYAELGRMPMPRKPWSRVRRKNPYLDLAGFGTRFQDPALKSRIEESLRKAGLN